MGFVLGGNNPSSNKSKTKKFVLGQNKEGTDKKVSSTTSPKTTEKAQSSSGTKFNINDIMRMDDEATDLTINGKSGIKKPAPLPNDYYSLKGEGTQKNNAMMLGSIDNATLGGANLVNKKINQAKAIIKNVTNKTGTKENTLSNHYVLGQPKGEIKAEKTIFEKAKEEHPDYYARGEMLGNIPLLATGIGADKLAANATKGIKIAQLGENATKAQKVAYVAKQAGKQALQDAIAGGGMGLAEGLMRQEKPSEIAKKTLVNAGIGAGIGFVSRGSAEGLEMLAKSKIKDVPIPTITKTETPSETIDDYLKTINNSNAEKTLKTVSYGNDGEAYMPHKQIEQNIKFGDIAKMDNGHYYLEHPNAKSKELYNRKWITKDEYDYAKWLQNKPVEAVTKQPVNSISEIASTTNTLPKTVQNTDTTIKKLNLNIKELPKGVQTKVSKFKTSTLTKTPELLGKETQNVIKNTEMMYEVKPNASTVQSAKAKLDKDFGGNVKRIMNTEGALSDAEDAAMVGLINKGLAKQAEQTGDYALYTAFTKKTRAKVTNTAQALQALKTWQMESPEDVVLYAQKIMDTANNEMVTKLGKKFKGAEFSPEDIKHIHEKAKNIFNMPQGRPREVVVGELRNYVGSKIPKSAGDKIKSFVRMSMLSSPTTGLRNFIGNTLFNAAENIKQPISGAVDAVTSLFTKQRTTPIIPSLKAQVKGMGEGAYRQVDDLIKGIDTSRSATATADMLDDNIGHTFNNPLMKKYEDYTKFLVRDDIFWQGAYNQRIKELQKLNKTDSITDDMIKQAKAFADERVFQNSTPLTEATIGIRKKAGLIGDVMLPFAKTPANIVSKTTDYLPVTGAYKIVKELHNATKGTFNQKRFVDLVGRLGLGSAVTALGYHLYNKGQLTLDPAKSRSEREFNKDIGKLPYSLKVNDKHIDISNYAPIASLLLAGAASAKKDMENGNKQNVDMISKLYDNSMAGLNSILDASYLKGLNQFFQDVQNPELGWTGAVTESVKGIPNMAIPNVLKRLNYSLDPYARETYSENKGLANDIKNSTIPNLPLLSSKLPKKVNGFGEDMKRTNKPMGIVESLFNPFVTAEKTKDPVKLEVDRLYQSSKESGILPEYDKYFEKIQYKGKSYQLTGEEKLQYKKLYGQVLMNSYKEIMSKKGYSNATDEAKVKILKYLQDHIRDGVKEQMLIQKLQGGVK